MRFPKTVTLEFDLEAQTICLDGDPVAVASPDSIAELHNGVISRIVARQLEQCVAASAARRGAPVPSATPAGRAPSFLPADEDDGDDEPVAEPVELDIEQVHADVVAFFERPKKS